MTRHGGSRNAAVRRSRTHHSRCHKKTHLPPAYEVATVDRNRVEGIKKEIKGSIKEGVGKVTGNKTRELAGKVEKNVGKAQNAVGKAADEARDANRKR